MRQVISMPIEEGRADILTWHLWDTLKIPKGVIVKANKSFELFVDPISKDKSWLDTCMTNAGVLPLPQHFNIQSMKPAYAELNNKQDNKLFKDNVVFVLIIGNKVYSCGPMAIFQELPEPENFESFLDSMRIARELGFKVNSHLSFLIGDDPIGHHILQGQRLKLELVFGKSISFEEDFKLIWFLDGVISRGVQ